MPHIYIHTYIHIPIVLQPPLNTLKVGTWFPSCHHEDHSVHFLTKCLLDGHHKTRQNLPNSRQIFPNRHEQHGMCCLVESLSESCFYKYEISCGLQKLIIMLSPKLNGMQLPYLYPKEDYALLIQTLELLVKMIITGFPLSHGVWKLLLTNGCKMDFWENYLNSIISYVGACNY